MEASDDIAMVYLVELDCPRQQPSKAAMPDNEDPLAQFGLDAIDLRWTLKDIAAKRRWLINKQHLAQLIDLGLVEMQEDVPQITIAGQNAAWKA